MSQENSKIRDKHQLNQNLNQNQEMYTCQQGHSSGKVELQWENIGVWLTGVSIQELHLKWFDHIYKMREGWPQNPVYCRCETIGANI